MCFFGLFDGGDDFVADTALEFAMLDEIFGDGEEENED